MRRLALCTLPLLGGLAVLVPATPAATLGCGYVDVPGGRAWKIYATRIDCPPARTVARRCLMGTVARGWRVDYNAGNDRTTMRSGRRVVSFQLVGGGGCIQLRAKTSGRPTVRVSPTTVAPGEAVTFTGRGWPADKAVDLRIGPPFSEADHFAWARVGDDGRFRRTVRFSASAEPGRYVVLACRRSCRTKAQAEVRVAL